jgi:outer membrane protein OmpA-like peptidoglycan-associated protein
MKSLPIILIIVFSTTAQLSFAKTDLDKSNSKEDPAITPFIRKSVSAPRLAPLTPMAPAAGKSRSYMSARNYLGIEVGMTTSKQFGGENYAVAGNYKDGIRNAELSDYAIGISLLAHAVLDISFNKDLGFQAKAGYRQHKTRATGVSPAGNVSGNDPQFENDVSFTWDYLGVDALFRVQLATDGIYALGGLGYSSLLSSFVAGTQSGFDVNSGNQQLTFQGELKDFYSSSRIDAKIGFGTWLPLGENGLVIVPELMIGYPLTPLHSQETIDTYKAIDREANNMAYATLGFSIKFPFGGNSSEDRIASSSSTTATNTTRTAEKSPEVGKAMLSGRVLDNFDRPIDHAQVTVTDLNNNEVVATDETADGIYNVKVDADGRYSVTANVPGYLFGSALFEVDKEGRVLKNSGDIKLSPSTDGRVRLLVFFDFDKATLQPSSYPELDRAVDLMKSDPSMQVEIAGFTDAQGTDAYNKDLSQRRANAVREYLIGQGVDDNRLTALGYGELNPVAGNETEDGRAENRRVEFVVKKR